jgi:FkbM family methyltransferase
MDLYHHSNPSFTRWVVAEKLLAEPFVVIDIGVQGGEHPRWQFLGPYAEIHGFDPIAEVIDELRRGAGQSQRRRYHNLALGDEDGNRRFFLPPNRFSSSFYPVDTTAEERLVAIRRLDSLFSEELVPRADYIKLDCEGFEPEVLSGARNYLAVSEVVCVTSETNFNVSPTLPRTHFAAINDILTDHRLLVYDMNLVRSPTAAYTAGLSTSGRSEPDFLRDASPLAIGRPGTCDVVFCRDFVSERADPDNFRRDNLLPRAPSIDTIIKSMINFELHGLMDCAVELAVTFRDSLASRFDVDHAVALLLLPAPHPRNTSDVTLTLAINAAQAAESKKKFDAERTALIAIIRELEGRIAAERSASVARIRELEGQLDAEHSAFIARIGELEVQQTTMQGAFVALLRVLVKRYWFLRRLNDLRRRLSERSRGPSC